MTKKQALELITLLQMAYPRQSLGEKNVEVYADFILDLDYQTAKGVLQNYIRTEKWFPTISEIRQACAEAIHFLPHPEEAMERVREAVRSGSYGMVSNHYLLQKAVDTVGYERLGRSQDSERLYRQIERAYERIRERELKRLQNTPAVGAKALGEGSA